MKVWIVYEWFGDRETTNMWCLLHQRESRGCRQEIRQTVPSKRLGTRLRTRT